MLPSPPSLTETRAEQGGTSGGHAQGNAARAQAVRQRFAVAKSVLEGDGKAIVRKAFPELTCDLVCLPCLDKDQRVLEAAAFTRVSGGMDVKLMFVAIGIQKTHAMRLQCIQPGFPGAQHGDGISRPRKARSKQARKRAGADDENVFHVWVLNSGHDATP